MKKLKTLILCSFMLFSCESKFLSDDMYRVNYVDKSNILRINSDVSLGSMDIDSEGNLYFPEPTDNVIKKITPDGKISIFAGTGKKGYKLEHKDKSELEEPYNIKIDENGIFYIGLYKENEKGKIITIDKNGMLSELKLPQDVEEYSPFLIGKNRVLIGLTKDFKNIIGKGLTYMNYRSSYINKFNDFLYLLYEIKSFTSNEYNLNEQDKNNNIKNLYRYQEDKFTNKKEISSINSFPMVSPPTSMTFDSEGNMYIGHRFGEISKFSSAKKYIKTYFTYEFNLNIFENKDNNNISSMLIDNKRKILYYTKSFGRDSYIYKITID